VNCGGERYLVTTWLTVILSPMQVLERGADPELLYSVDKLSMDQVNNTILFLLTRAQTAARMTRDTFVIANVAPVTGHPFQLRPIGRAGSLSRHSLPTQSGTSLSRAYPGAYGSVCNKIEVGIRRLSDAGGRAQAMCLQACWYPAESPAITRGCFELCDSTDVDSRGWAFLKTVPAKLFW
jgi:hypothetical protein